MGSANQAAMRNNLAIINPHTYTANNAGSVLTAGFLSKLPMAYTGTFTSFRGVLDVTGSATVLLKKNGTTIATLTITSAATPATAVTDLSAWSATTFSANDVLSCEVSAATTATSVTITFGTI